MTMRRAGLLQIIAFTGALAGIGVGVGIALADDAPKRGEPPGAPKSKTGLLVDKPGAFQGYTLLSPLGHNSTYLIDMGGKVVQSWKTDGAPASCAYLVENGHLLRPAEYHDQPFGGGPGAGGRIQEFTWDGEIVWDYRYANKNQLPHHDIHRLPNGNILMIVWERKTPEEAIAAGRRKELAGDRPMQLDSILEVKPTGKTSGEIVWEWHLWDHLIQDQDPSKANYGDVAAHPELVDINSGDGFFNKMLKTKDGLDKLRSLGYLGSASKDAPNKPINPDWTHTNSVDYNPELDQIVISIHSFSEIWIIDHSTTTAEAKGHTGGRGGKGGDLLYRWGNPAAYRTGTAADQKLFHQHNAHWIPKGLPGAGHLLLFNNGSSRPGEKYSTVDELILPADEKGHYTRKPGEPFGPDKPVWSYSAPKKSDFYSFFISGAQRLANGNTLICSGASGTLFEVTPEKEIVWKYINPVKGMKNPPGFGPPKAGELLVFFLRDMLHLSPDQRRELDSLQEEIDSGLSKILTADQNKRFKERSGSGPPGPGAGPGAGGMTPPGKIMALSTQIALKPTAEQKASLKALQDKADAGLDRILKPDQKSQLKRMAEDFARGGPPGFRPGPGPGGPGGKPPGGPGGPGGPPPFGGPPGGPGGPPPFGGPGGHPPHGGPGNSAAVFRVYRYAADYAGLAGKTLKPGKTVEELQPKQPEPKKEER